MIFESNMVNVAEALKDKLNKVVNTRQLQGEIALQLLASNRNRIYRDGRNVNEDNIGSYSTKDTLVGAKSFRTKGGASKAFTKSNRKKSDWATVKGHKLMVLQGGYKAIRALDGDFTGTVILKRTGKMLKELQLEEKQGEWLIGFPASYSNSLSYKEMISNFEKKYACKIWGITANDEKKIMAIINRHIKQSLNG